MARILVVDDDPVLRELMLECLTEEGHNVSFAVHGQEALAILSHSIVDLVVTDIVMTKGDGLSVLRALKEKNPELPVIVVSGGSTVFEVDHLLQLAKTMKASACIKKPFSPFQFIDIVQQVLKENQNDA